LSGDREGERNTADNLTTLENTEKKNGGALKVLSKYDEAIYGQTKDRYSGVHGIELPEEPPDRTPRISRLPPPRKSRR
jgi:hypothetical protein